MLREYRSMGPFQKSQISRDLTPKTVEDNETWIVVEGYVGCAKF